MFMLNASAKTLEVVLDGAPSSQLPWVSSWVDFSPRVMGPMPGATDGVTASTVAVTVLPSTLSDEVARELQFFSIVNIANASRIVTVRLNNNGTARNILVVTLQVGDQLQYSNKSGWYVLDSSGEFKTAVAQSLSGFTSVEEATTQRTLKSRLTSPGTSFTLISGTSYFVYLGRTVTPITPKYIEFYLDVVSAGDVAVFEVGLFSSPLAPNKASQTLTKLVSTAACDALASGLGVKRNTSNLATLIPAATHLWAGCRAANTGTPTQPSIAGLLYDNLHGEILLAAGSAAFSATASYTGALVGAQSASAPVVCCPDLQATLD